MCYKYLLPSYFILASAITSVQSSKPYSKTQLAIWRVECELGVISDPECPVDGGWAGWGPWSACRGACDDTGHRTRTRKCTNPAPSADGIPCSGPDEEIEPCYLSNCTVEDFRKLCARDTVRKEAFHQLEAVPALMERCLQMECPFEAIEAALMNDNTWHMNPETLWNALQCVRHNLGCSVTGEWGPWGAWSACGARCGQGLRWRLRRCDTPPPSDADRVCVGSPLSSEECEGNQCAIDVRNISEDANGNWSEWGDWTLCSESCGFGVSRRRRTCNERIPAHAASFWGTHCAGPHDQLEVCERNECILDGGWSGWSAWGPCSQPCGAGKRSRTRSCTRPIPAGRGEPCVGPRSEVGTCYLSPCEVHSHTVALFNGDTILQYDFQNKRSTLFHFYIRFYPLSPHGTLVRRGSVHNPLVRLSLQKWHLCLDANGNSKSCTLPRLCTPTAIEPGVWHSALVTVNSEAATLRVDDAKVGIRGTFQCDPDLTNERTSIIIGEKFHGIIQEILLNFIPLDMVIPQERKLMSSDFFPSAASNVVYETADKEEAYLPLFNDQYLRLPCFDDQNEWRLELTIKPKREAGTIVFLQNEMSNNWLHVGLLNMRLKMKMAMGSYRSESSSSTEHSPEQWLDVTLSKKRGANTIEAILNAGEKLHVVFEDDHRESRGTKFIHQQFFEQKRPRQGMWDNASDGTEEFVNLLPSEKPDYFTICDDEFFVGGVPAPVKQRIADELNFFSGFVASVSINNAFQDLHAESVERYKDHEVQVSSRTASVSGSYHEIAWGKSNRLNLTCLHARTVRSPNTAHWLFLDTGIARVVREKTVRSVDDGRVLRLVATADNDLRGFYTCRAHTNKRSRNIVTYGVLGSVKYHLTGPDTTTVIAVFSTVSLIIGTLTWLIIEGINDLRNGFGFFRDAHLSPEDEADAVCRYIDEHMDLIGSESAARVAKAKARKKCQRLASRANFGAQEPQGLRQLEMMGFVSDQSMVSEPECLPALPEGHAGKTVEPLDKSSSLAPTHEVFRCEPCYISSPRHGSNLSSPNNRWSSSSTFELTSPRVLCSRLLMAKRIYSSRESMRSKKRNRVPVNHHFDLPLKNTSKLLTIKSSTFVNLSPGQKILQKFQELKGDDDC